MTIILMGTCCIACDLRKNEVTVVENKNIIIKKFESDAEYIFGNQILGKKIFFL